MGTNDTDSHKLIKQHKNRIVFIYRSALKYFKEDVSLWKEYIKFLIKCVSEIIYYNVKYCR